MTERNVEAVRRGFPGLFGPSRWHVGLFRVLSLFLLLFIIVHGSEAQESDRNAKQILLLYEYQSTLTSVRQMTEGVLGVLEQNETLKVEVYSEYLDMLRFPGADHLAQLRESLAAKYRGKKFDLVVTGGPNALKFVLDNRERIAPGAPVVFGGVRRSTAKSLVLPADVRGVVSTFDIGGTVSLAYQIQQNARGIVVITGSSAFDENWQSSARKQLGDRFEGLHVEYVSGLTIKGFEQYVRGLDNRSIVVLLSVATDADGVSYVPRESALQIAAASNAPVYTVYSSYLGPWIVGGRIDTFSDIGKAMGLLAVQILNGEMPSEKTRDVLERDVLDWREMVRRGMDPALVPADATLLNYERSAWDRYSSAILLAISVIFLQFATIAALFFQERRRRNVVAERAVERAELLHLARATKLGELSGAFAHELSQPLTSILANAEVGDILLNSSSFDVEEMREIIKDIIEDNKRAAKMINNLKQLLVKGEINDELFDLNLAVIATVELARGELTSRRTDVDLRLCKDALPVKGNRSQIQQIVLNLLINAADAMSQVEEKIRTVAIHTRKYDNELRELVVSDQGPGISPELRADIFKPFVSTKENGLGLGLAICQTIAKAHGGRLRIGDETGPGAKIVLELPRP